MKLSKEEYKAIHTELETEELLMQLETFMRLPNAIDSAHEVLKERGLTNKEIRIGRKRNRLPTKYSTVLDWALTPINLITWKTYVATYDTLFESTATTKTGDQLFTNEEKIVKREYWHTFKYSDGNKSYRAIYKSKSPNRFKDSDNKKIIYNPKEPEQSKFFPYSQLGIYLFILGASIYVFIQ